MGEVVLVSGDELLAEEALLEERAAAVGQRDPSWVLTEVGPGPGFAEELAATATLGLGEDRRVVVVRRAGALDAPSWDALVSYVGSVPDHVSLVIEGQGWASPARARSLSDHVRAAGGRVRREQLPPPAKRADMVKSHAARRGLHLDAPGARYLAEYLGDEIGNLGGVLDQLVAIHGTGSRLTEADLARQFQGPRHGYQWDITDALDRGDAPAALEYIHGAFDHMHPLQVHAALVTHYRRILAVVGRGLTPARAAAELGIKEFPARKVVDQAHRLGVDRARRAYELLADADVALRGGSGALDEEGVIELLVVQLSGLVRPASSRSDAARGMQRPSATGGRSDRGRIR